MKKIYYLVSLPRAGNTVSAAVINQNKKIKMTANSILPQIMDKMDRVHKGDAGQNFPDSHSFLNLIKGTFQSYYKDWEADVILERGAWGKPRLMNLITKIEEPQFIILHRPLLECLASFINVVKPRNNKGEPITDLYCTHLMNDDEIMGENLLSINNILNSKFKYHLIEYKNFVKNPQEEINKLCNFVNIKPHSIDVNQLTQLNINGIEYNDEVIHYPFHKIKEKKIVETPCDVEKILGKKIIKKYSEKEIRL
jgi:hypothetical protein|tara:strand:+ start:85 stop:843 length:759 start_codon:yes stop_codon:yes gene_type:complete